MHFCLTCNISNKSVWRNILLSTGCLFGCVTQCCCLFSMDEENLPPRRNANLEKDFGCESSSPADILYQVREVNQRTSNCNYQFNGKKKKGKKVKCDKCGQTDEFCICKKKIMSFSASWQDEQSYSVSLQVAYNVQRVWLPVRTNLVSETFLKKKSWVCTP